MADEMTEREMLAQLIRGEIVKGWDFPLHTTPESQSGAAADALLAAGFRRIPTEGDAFEAGVDRAVAAYNAEFNTARGHTKSLADETSALRAALASAEADRDKYKRAFCSLVEAANLTIFADAPEQRLTNSETRLPDHTDAPDA